MVKLEYKIGDCLELMKELEDNSIDLVLTDPPYGINYKTNHRKNKNHEFCSEIQNDADLSIIKNIVPELHRVLKDNTAVYLFCSSNNVEDVKPIISEYFDIKNTIIWVKNNWTAGDLECSFGKQYECIILANKGKKTIESKRHHDVWFFDRCAGNDVMHQNQKPIKLINRCIESHSKEGDLICDPFLGSGTTLRACRETNRNCIGFEKEPKYEPLIRKRAMLDTPDITTYGSD